MLRPWESAENPLDPTDDNCLYWRTGEHVPKNLLMLDTPDIDADQPINWQRARSVRQAADVLIAVLTGQKYNDATVKQFFREAAQADKPVILLFNLCELDDGPNSDIQHLPRWRDQFCEETGVKPLAVYVAPYDKTAVEAGKLPFYELPRKSGGCEPAGDPPAGSHPPLLREPISLTKALSELHFDEIKAQTLAGAIRQLYDPESGMETYLNRIRRTAQMFGEAQKSLGSVEEATIDWPGLPNQVLIAEMRSWWNERRPDWSQKIHGAYRKIGEGILWPIKTVYRQFAKKDPKEPGTKRYAAQSPDEAIEEFRREEFNSVMQLVEKTIQRLEKLAQSDNAVLREVMETLLRGDHRKAFIDQAKRAHAEMKPVDDDFREHLRAELDRWSSENPGTLSFARYADHAAAVARPAVTLTLGLGGFSLAGGVLTHLMTEAAIAGGVTATGEAVIHQSGEGLLGSLSRLFRRLQLTYAEDRARHIMDWLQQSLWSDVMTRLTEGERLTETEEYISVTQMLHQLQLQR